jgi:hypothetical protein
MLSNFRIYDLFPMGLELSERTFLVATHKSAVPCYICRQNRS